MSTISSHVLDSAQGCPARGIKVVLDQFQLNQHWKTLGEAVTNEDGRIPHILPEGTTLSPGTYRLTFETAPYFAQTGTPAFYPWVPVVFEIQQAGGHFHVPLLLSPFGYSTYRGS